MPLSAAHHDLLMSEGIANPNALPMRYQSVTDGKELEGYGFSAPQRRSGLLITLFGVEGRAFLHQLNPDHPRTVGGRVLEQEFPKGSKLSLDVPPRCQPTLSNNAVPLFVVDRPFEADILAALGHCAVDLLGMGSSVAGRRGRLSTLRDWENIALAGREVFRLVTGPTTPDEMPRLDEAARCLVERGAAVQLLTVPPTEGPTSQTLAQYLRTGGSIQALLESALKVDSEFQHRQFADSFIERDGGIYEAHIGRDGRQTETPLTNFTARIVAELIVTDGVEEHREFRVNAVVAGRQVSCDVPSENFGEMGWVAPKLGAEAIIGAGAAVKDRVRAAIQQLSAPVPKVEVRTDIGWFKGGDESMFVHFGGIIRGRPTIERPVATEVPPTEMAVNVCGSSEAEERPATTGSRVAPGPACTPGADVGPGGLAVPTKDPERKTSAAIGFTQSGPTGPPGPSQRKDTPVRFDVRIPKDLELYCLPQPPSGDRLVNVVLRTLQLTESPLPEVFTPFFAATYGAVLGGVPANLWVEAKSGNLKSSIAAIFASAFGPGFTADTLPGSWSSTENALLALAHYLKDVLLVVDDWLPGDTPGETAAQTKKADVLFRSAANRAARGRCRSDGTLRESRVPRSTLVSTAESMPIGDSLAARLVHIKCGGAALFANPQVHAWLNKRQSDAASGVYAATMSAFIEWLAPRLDTTRAAMEEHADGLRNIIRTNEPDIHPRQAENLADLLARFDCFLDFAEDVGAIDSESRHLRFKRAHETLNSIATSAAQTRKEFNIVDYIFDVVREALLTRKRHLLSLNGDVPDARAEACGWIVNRKWVQVKRGKHWTNRYGNPYPDSVGRSQRSEDAGYAADHNNEKCGSDDSDSKNVAEVAEVEELEQRVAYPAGECLGFVDVNCAYLLPEALLALVLSHSRATEHPIHLNSKNLGTILRDAGKLVDWDKKRCKCTVRRNVSANSRVNVYQIDLSGLMPEAWHQHPELEPGYEGDTPLSDILEA